MDVNLRAVVTGFTEARAQTEALGNSLAGTTAKIGMTSDQLKRHQEQIVIGWAKQDEANRKAAQATFLASEEYKKLDQTLVGLRGRLDPVFTATKRLEEAQDTLTRAVQAGMLSKQEYNRLLEKTRDEFKAATTQGMSLADVYGQMRSAVALLAGAGGLGMAAGALFEAGAKAERFNVQIGFATGSALAGADALMFVKKTADDLGLSQVVLTEAYIKLSAAAKNTTLTSTQTKEIFLAVAEAARVMGLSGGELSGVMLALTQMISKGKVTAEELRGQLGERLPGAFDLAAKAMGVTTAQLDNMLRKGGIAVDEFLPKFSATLREHFGKGITDASKTASAELERLSNTWLDFKTAVSESWFLPAATFALREFTAAMRGFAGVAASLDDDQLARVMAAMSGGRAGSRESDVEAAKAHLRAVRISRERGIQRSMEIGLVNEQAREQDIRSRRASANLLDIAAQYEKDFDPKLQQKGIDDFLKDQERDRKQAAAQRKRDDEEAFKRIQQYTEEVSKVKEEADNIASKFLEQHEIVSTMIIPILNEQGKVIHEITVYESRRRADLKEIEKANKIIADLMRGPMIEGLEAVTEESEKFVYTWKHSAPVAVAQTADQFEREVDDLQTSIQELIEAGKTPAEAIAKASEGIQITAGRTRVLRSEIKDTNAQQKEFMKLLESESFNAMALMEGGFRTMQSGISSSLKGLLRGTDDLGDAMKRVFGSVVDAIIDMFASWLTKQIFKSFMGLLDDIKSGWTEGFSGLFKGLFESIGNFFTSVFGESGTGTGGGSGGGGTGGAVVSGTASGAAQSALGGGGGGALGGVAEFLKNPSGFISGLFGGGGGAITSSGFGLATAGGAAGGGFSLAGAPLMNTGSGFGLTLGSGGSGFGLTAGGMTGVELGVGGGAVSGGVASGGGLGGVATKSVATGTGIGTTASAVSPALGAGLVLGTYALMNFLDPIDKESPMDPHVKAAWDKYHLAAIADPIGDVYKIISAQMAVPEDLKKWLGDPQPLSEASTSPTGWGYSDVTLAMAYRDMEKEGYVDWYGNNYATMQGYGLRAPVLATQDGYATGGELVLTSPRSILVGDTPEKVKIEPLAGSMYSKNNSGVTLVVQGLSLMDSFAAKQLEYALRRIVSA